MSNKSVSHECSLCTQSKCNCAWCPQSLACHTCNQSADRARWRHAGRGRGNSVYVSHSKIRITFDSCLTLKETSLKEPCALHRNALQALLDLQQMQQARSPDISKVMSVCQTSCVALAARYGLRGTANVCLCHSGCLFAGTKRCKLPRRHPC